MKKKRKKQRPDRRHVFSHPALVLVFSIFFGFVPHSTVSQSPPNGDSTLPALREIFHDIACLQLQPAARRLDSLESTSVVAHPLHPFLEHYIDFFPAFLDGHPTYYQRIQDSLDLRLEEMAKAGEDTPWKGYCRGEALLQTALLDLKFQHYFRGLRHLRKALRMLEENVEQYPDFKGHYKSLGLLHALAGTVPEQWRWGIRWLSGIEGDLELGMREMGYAMESNPDRYIFRDEAAAVYAFALYHLKDQPEQSMRVLKKLSISPEESPLVLYLQTNLYLKEGMTDRVIRLLEDRTYEEGTYVLHHLDLLLGKAKLYRGDDDAEQYLERFVTASPGNTFVKEAYQKLSWAAFLDGRYREFQRYRQCIIWYGEEETDEDVSALREAEQNEPLHRGLVRARLYFDGGYYERALHLLDTTEFRPDEEERFQLEYFYRKARCLHELGQQSRAMALYLKTIERGRDRPEYFACNAALQAGKIYEEAGRPGNAEKMYRLCLDLRPEVYERSLHQKAKAGLERVR